MPATSRSSVVLPAPLWPMMHTRSPSSSSRSILLSAWITNSAPACLTLLAPTLARPNEGMRSKRRPPASNTGMRTLTSSILTWDMTTAEPRLNEERQVAPHPAVRQIGQHIPDHGYRQDDGIGSQRRPFAEQGCSHALDEIAQHA